MPLHVTNADLEDAEIEEASELNSAEDKMLHQNECRNMRRKTVVLVSRVTNPSRQKVAAALDTAFPGIPSHNRAEPDKLQGERLSL
jgi:predicted phosphoribosyltransferase